jgi:hypothetical protein
MMKSIDGVGIRRARHVTLPLIGMVFSMLQPIATWSQTVTTEPITTETIVFVRHGEKPAAGLGQLDCQGLNRALALPPVIAAFGKVDAIFAPNPSQQKEEDGRSYSYVRPLATIEPTAIRLGLPVNTAIGLTDISSLRTALEQPSYRQALVVVVWEHKQIEAIARALLAAHGGNPARVPHWSGKDFDSLYVITLTRHGDATTASFDHKREGLDGQPTACPF